MLTFHNKSGKPPIYSQFPVGGTSESSPLVAGLVAAAQQGQPASFGLVNPALYQLAGTSALYDALPLTSSSPVAYRGVACDPHDCGLWALTTFDDQSSGMFGYTGQVTLPGYDNMTGVGTPAGRRSSPACARSKGDGGNISRSLARWPGPHGCGPGHPGFPVSPG